MPKEKGFLNIAFDDLTNHYDNAGKNHRGYLINTDEFVRNLKQEIEILKPNNESINQNLDDVILLANPIANFSKYTNKSSFFNECASLYASKDYLTKHNLKENSMVKIYDEDNEMIIKVVLDDSIENGAYLPTFDEKINPYKFFKTRRYCVLNIKEISHE